jgi:hypothetical protein
MAAANMIRSYPPGVSCSTGLSLFGGVRRTLPDYEAKKKTVIRSVAMAAMTRRGSAHSFRLRTRRSTTMDAVTSTIQRTSINISRFLLDPKAGAAQWVRRSSLNTDERTHGTRMPGAAQLRVKGRIGVS